MTEKLYKVLVDAGDMTSLQRALAILQHVECTGQKVPKQVQEAMTGLHNHRHYIFWMGKACQSLIIDVNKKRQDSTIIGITYFEWEKFVKV